MPHARTNSKKLFGIIIVDDLAKWSNGNGIRRKASSTGESGTQQKGWTPTPYGVMLRRSGLGPYRSVITITSISMIKGTTVAMLAPQYVSARIDATRQIAVEHILSPSGNVRDGARCTYTNFLSRYLMISFFFYCFFCDCFRGLRRSLAAVSDVH